MEKNQSEETKCQSDVDVWVTDTPRAWRRFLARQLDTLTVVLFLSVIFVLILSILDEAETRFLEGPISQLLAGIVMIVLATIPNAIILAATGRSLGKLIFGLRVSNAQGRPPSIGSALSREFQVTTFGLGLGIPILSLFALYQSYDDLREKGETAWDQDGEFTVYYRRSSIAHRILFLVGTGIFLIMWIGLYVINLSQRLGG